MRLPIRLYGQIHRNVHAHVLACAEYEKLSLSRGVARARARAQANCAEKFSLSGSSYMRPLSGAYSNDKEIASSRDEMDTRQPAKPLFMTSG
jgi:hypothetical protein